MDTLKRHNVQVLGRGTVPLIFAHGFGCDQQMWRFITPAFEEAYRVILFDYVGHGKPRDGHYDAEKYSSLDGFADDILEICHTLGVHDAVFVGHSVSAAIGIIAAIKEPSLFAKMVLICPSPCYVNDGDYVGGFTRQDVDGLLDYLDSNYLGWSRSMAPTIMGNGDRPELGSELAESFCRTDPAVARSFARVTFLSDTRDDLPRVATPALILQCKQDVIAPPSVGQYVHERLRGSSLVTLDATGHCPHLSAPKETIAAIHRYLSGE